jgi:hypothetical protein
MNTKLLMIIAFYIFSVLEKSRRQLPFVLHPFCHRIGRLRADLPYGKHPGGGG